MKCRACGYVSLEDGPCCKRCGADREGRVVAPPPAAPEAGRDPAPPPKAARRPRAARPAKPAAAPMPLFEEPPVLAVDPAPQPGGHAVFADIAADLAADLASLRLSPEPPPEPGPDVAGGGDAVPAEAAAAEPAATFLDDEDELLADVEMAGEEDLAPAGEPFHLDDDVIPPAIARGEAGTFARLSPPGPPADRLALPREPDEEAEPDEAAPIFDRHEEIPERFWAPEGAPVGRRIAAQVVDQAALVALLLLFYGGALLALALAGYDGGRLLTAEGLAAVALPFALLDLLLGTAYFTFFHGWRGSTPGKRLAGIEVRTADGEAPSYARAFLRSLAGAAGLAAAGIGLVWALVEPRRRGWADLASGTVVRSSHFV